VYSRADDQTGWNAMGGVVLKEDAQGKQKVGTEISLKSVQAWADLAQNLFFKSGTNSQNGKSGKSGPLAAGVMPAHPKISLDQDLSRLRST